MPVVAVTRLSVRSLRFLPGFMWHAVRSERQARKADGCLRAEARREKGLVFWTRTAWRDETAMRAYMTTGAHKKAMPKLQYWCNEASLVHWTDGVGQLPDWNLAEERLRRDGRVSRVRYPSHAQTQGITVPST
jgi:quinol monooxygenase YgiN